MTLNHRVRRTRVVHLPVLAVLATLGVSGGAHAQGQGGRAPAGPPPSPQAAAPIDLTGYWVSIVTQDWRQRMVTPPRGDYESVPITVEAKKVGDGWDPVKDEAAGEQCRSYGAPALMRVPGRVRITWQDDTTLKVELDAGAQTRLFHFGSRVPAGASASWQGYSVAGWETSGGAQPKSGSLRVVTTQLRPGYLRKNGVPYSANAVLTEHWDLFTLPNGEAWITITNTVEDPLYLRTPWLAALHFKKEPDGSKWDPSPCSATW
jgi:hypothetical protein